MNTKLILPIALSAAITTLVSCGGGKGTETSQPTAQVAANGAHKLSDNLISIDKKYYQIAYNPDVKGAEKITYTLTKDKVNNGNIKKRPKFYTEKLLPKKLQTHTKDYSNTGYDRGHIANDASFDWSKESQKSTYSMANIVPQLPNTNRRAWLSVEEVERYTATQLNTIEVTNIIAYKDDSILSKKPIDQVVERLKFDSSAAKEKYMKKYKRAADSLKKKAIRIPSGFYKVLENKERNFKECYYVPQGASKSVASDYLINCNMISY